MDDVVLRSMARWPNVPAVYGWLGLDRRGRWRLQGEPLEHPRATDFINRNYAGDLRGRWYFQNGPQRVYVQLEYTPWVYRLDASGALQAHTGAVAGFPRQVFMDETGAVLLETGLGIGVLDDRDLAPFAAALGDAASAPVGDDEIVGKLSTLARGGLTGLYYHHTHGRLPLQPIRRELVAAQFEFVPEPRDGPGAGAGVRMS